VTPNQEPGFFFLIAMTSHSYITVYSSVCRSCLVLTDVVTYRSVSRVCKEVGSSCL